MRLGKKLVSAIRRASTPRLLGLLLILPLLGGCTSKLWNDVGDESMHFDRIVGVRAAVDGQPAALIVRYDVNFDGKQPHDFVLPLDKNGMPPQAYLYQGKQRRLSLIRLDLKASQLPSNSLLTPVGKSLRESTATRVFAKDQSESAEWGLGGDTRAFGVRRASDGLPVLVLPVVEEGVETSKDGYRYATSEAIWPDDCLILRLPDKQPRPKSEHDRAKFGAAMLTPLTVAADVVLVPVVAVYLLLGGSR